GWRDPAAGVGKPAAHPVHRQLDLGRHRHQPVVDGAGRASDLWRRGAADPARRAPRGPARTTATRSRPTHDPAGLNRRCAGRDRLRRDRLRLHVRKLRHLLRGGAPADRDRAPDHRTARRTTHATRVGGSMSARLVVSHWRLEPGLTAALALYGAVYLWAAHRTGSRWPIRRTLAFMAGLLSIVIALESGIDSYDDRLLSVHMVQHMILLMLAPLLLLAGQPALLALKALPSARSRRRLAHILRRA